MKIKSLVTSKRNNDHEHKRNFITVYFFIRLQLTLFFLILLVLLSVIKIIVIDNNIRRFLGVEVFVHKKTKNIKCLYKPSSKKIPKQE
jgi:hypothetical protein